MLGLKIMTFLALPHFSKTSIHLAALVYLVGWYTKITELTEPQVLVTSSTIRTFYIRLKFFQDALCTAAVLSFVKLKNTNFLIYSTVANSTLAMIIFEC